MNRMSRKSPKKPWKPFDLPGHFYGWKKVNVADWETKVWPYRLFVQKPITEREAQGRAGAAVNSHGCQNGF
jgi:hypothetical protein